MAKLVAVVTAYDRVDFVETCIRSILSEANDDLTIKVIVKDNGSSDGTGEAALAVDTERVVVRSTKDNRHFITVLNEGLEEALAEEEASYIVLMNEDTRFTPGSLRRLVQACDAEPNGVFTPMQMNYREPEFIDDNAFSHIREIRLLAEDAVMGRSIQQMYPVTTIIGACIFARTEVWNNVGMFDPIFTFYGTDDDFCKRAKLLGHENWLVPEAKLLHAHGKIGAERKKLNKQEEFQKWKAEMQAMLLFILKDSERSLGKNYARVLMKTLSKSFQFLFRNGWPKGALHVWLIYIQLIGKRGAVNASRKMHFDLARSVGPPLP